MYCNDVIHTTKPMAMLVSIITELQNSLPMSQKFWPKKSSSSSLTGNEEKLKQNFKLKKSKLFPFFPDANFLYFFSLAKIFASHSQWV
ncbi:hypothetical protein DERF_011884 [Dermatophagoides farinae]|uniref:Uncharacterized protein n=1 Tax=Dermatophagoides farinae TaxID=6954 RepID=A0A922HNJ5_DERFA|nr:hypothetical protein DERF_011884 [Dermatophagoides farinae]